MGSQSFSSSFFFLRAALGVLMIAGLTGAGLAQNVAREVTVTGEVTDPSNAAVVNAQVTLTNNASHSAKHAVTNQAGVYRFQEVVPGTYTLTRRLTSRSCAMRSTRATMTGWLPTILACTQRTRWM